MVRRTAQSTTVRAVLKEVDTAEYLQVSRAFLRHARIGRGEGPPFVKIGRSVRYRLIDLDAWLEQRTMKAAS